MQVEQEAELIDRVEQEEHQAVAVLVVHLMVQDRLLEQQEQQTLEAVVVDLEMEVMVAQAVQV